MGSEAAFLIVINPPSPASSNALSYKGRYCLRPAIASELLRLSSAAAALNWRRPLSFLPIVMSHDKSLCLKTLVRDELAALNLAISQPSATERVRNLSTAA
jgi:hypothetical protein